MRTQVLGTEGGVLPGQIMDSVLSALPLPPLASHGVHTRSLSPAPQFLGHLNLSLVP